MPLAVSEFSASLATFAGEMALTRTTLTSCHAVSTAALSSEFMFGIRIFCLSLRVIVRKGW